MYGGQLREFVCDYVNKGTPLYNGILHKMRPGHLSFQGALNSRGQSS